MSTETRAAHRSLLPGALLTALGFAWFLGVPYLLSRMLLATPWWTESTAADRAAAHSWLFATMITATALPAVGIVLAVLFDRRGGRIFFSIAFALGLLLAIGLGDGYRHTVTRDPQPDRGPVYCVERSGGGNECPGD